MNAHVRSALPDFLGLKSSEKWVTVNLVPEMLSVPEEALFCQNRALREFIKTHAFLSSVSIQKLAKRERNSNL